MERELVRRDAQLKTSCDDDGWKNTDKSVSVRLV